MRDWIPVTERLPNSGELVAVAVNVGDEKAVSVDILQRSGEWTFSPKREITHWMKLPEPPEGREEG